MSGATHLAVVGAMLVTVSCGSRSSTDERDAGFGISSLEERFDWLEKKRGDKPIDESREYQLAWNRRTLAEDYKHIGSRNPAWDEAAFAALEAWAILVTPQAPGRAGASETCTENLKKAIAAGCDDPLIRYRYARDVLANTLPKAELAEYYLDVAAGIAQTEYHTERKLNATFRAYRAAWAAGGGLRERSGSVFEKAWPMFCELVNMPEVPVGVVTESVRWLLDSGRDSYADERFMLNLIDPIVENWGGSLEAGLLQAHFLIKFGWAARGHGYASTVTEEGWNQFNERMELAEKTLSSLWFDHKSEPRIPMEMLVVGLSLSYPRSDYEVWFNRAMTAQPDNFRACGDMLNYLKPRWFGSFDDMVAFGRRCATNANWSGRVPLVLVDAHDHIANQRSDETAKAAYWKSQEVWKDIDMAFTRFFELNPDAWGWHHNYALYAYRCGQWETLRREIGLLGEVNHSYFGGVEAFEEMKRLAFEHTGGESP